MTRHTAALLDGWEIAADRHRAHVELRHNGTPVAGWSANPHRMAAAAGEPGSFAYITEAIHAHTAPAHAANMARIRIALASALGVGQ